MTWRQIMTYAHQGIEVKNIPGVAPGPTPAAPQVAAASPSGEPAAQRPTMLTKRSIDVLLRVERLMENATRALADASASQKGAALPASDTVASAASGARGN
jgi:penicillin-binding protein 1A